MRVRVEAVILSIQDRSTYDSEALLSNCSRKLVRCTFSRWVTISLVTMYSAISEVARFDHEQIARVDVVINIPDINLSVKIFFEEDWDAKAFDLHTIHQVKACSNFLWTPVRPGCPCC